VNGEWCSSPKTRIVAAASRRRNGDRRSPPDSARRRSHQSTPHDAGKLDSVAHRVRQVLLFEFRQLILYIQRISLMNTNPHGPLMQRQIAYPDALDFDTPGRRDYFVRFEHPTAWGDFLIPVTVIVGQKAQPGCGLVAIGSTHGNEYEGPVAIKNLVHNIDADKVIGRIILIPVLNVSAFKAGKRDTPEDGVNLNRAFPGDVPGSITYRFADFVNRFIFPQVHVVIDIHSGGEQIRFARCTSFHIVEDPDQHKAMAQTARDFGCRFVMIYQDNTPGLLTSTAERLGKITIGSELGWGESVSREGVSMARQGILSAAVRQGQMSGELPSNEHCPAGDQILVDNSEMECYVLAPFEGHYEPVADCGDRMSPGQLIGYLHDFDRIDEPPAEIRSPHDGYLLCQSWHAGVFRGEVAAVVSKVKEWPNP